MRDISYKRKLTVRIVVAQSEARVVAVAEKSMKYLHQMIYLARLNKRFEKPFFKK